MVVTHPASILKTIYPSLVWKIETTKPTVFLTFDDGPTPGVTDRVLEILAKYNACATFFCLGKNIVNHPTLFSQIIAEKHRIGNHTFNHSNGWKSSTLDFIEDVKKFEEVHSTNLFRPPYGRLRHSQIQYLKKEYKVIMWSSLSMDYHPTTSKEKVLKLSLKNLQPGSIIVFHDSLKAKDKMLYALENLLIRLDKIGLSTSLLF